VANKPFGKRLKPKGASASKKRLMLFTKRLG